MSFSSSLGRCTTFMISVKSQENSIYCRKYTTFAIPRRDARVAEEARLESVCTPKAYRGFESLSLRKAKGRMTTVIRFLYNESP